MINIQFRFLNVIVCAVWFFWSSVYVAYSQESNTSEVHAKFKLERVAVVNIDKVLRDAKATERVRDLLDEKREEFQNDFATREASLLRIERELQSKRTILSEEAYRAEVAQFQNEVASIQKEIQFKRQALDKAFQEAQDEIRTLATEIVAEIARNQRLDIVINKNSALVFRQDLDITKVVITQLNDRTKNARLEIQEE